MSSPMSLMAFVNDKVSNDYWDSATTDLVDKAFALLEPYRKSIEERLAQYTKDMPWSKFRDTLWLMYVEYNPDVRLEMRDLLNDSKTKADRISEKTKAAMDEAAKEACDPTGLKELGIDFRDEVRRQMEDQKYQAEEQAKFQEQVVQVQEAHPFPRVCLWDLVGMVARQGWDGPRAEECQALQAAAMKPHFSSEMILEIVDGTWIITFVSDVIDHDRSIEIRVHPDGHCTITRNQELASSVQEYRTISF